MSRHINSVVHKDYSLLRSFVEQLPERFEKEGSIIYKGRNELRHFYVEGFDLIVKSYTKANWINRYIYGFLRSSKAQRAYEYALRFIQHGIASPLPVGYLTLRQGGVLEKSYFICLKSTCKYDYRAFKKQSFEHQEAILQAIGETTARMHNAGFLHKDYSAGNILFSDQQPVPIEIIDLNRMRFHKISLEEGCQNFDRLPATPEMAEIMAKAYAKVRGLNETQCITLITRYTNNDR